MSLEGFKMTLEVLKMLPESRLRISLEGLRMSNVIKGLRIPLEGF